MCLNNDNIASLDSEIECSAKITKKLDVNYDKVVECIKLSYDLEENESVTTSVIEKNQNGILENNLFEIYEHNVHFFPSVSIQGEEYRGNLDYDGILEAICASYRNDYPDICQKYGFGRSLNNNKDSTHKLLFIILLIIGCSLLFFWY